MIGNNFFLNIIIQIQFSTSTVTIIYSQVNWFSRQSIDFKQFVLSNVCIKGLYRLEGYHIIYTECKTTKRIMLSTFKPNFKTSSITLAYGNTQAM